MAKNLLPKNADWIEIVEAAHDGGTDEEWADRLVDVVKPIFPRSLTIGLMLGEHDENLRSWKMTGSRGIVELTKPFRSTVGAVDTSTLAAFFFPPTMVNTQSAIARRLSRRDESVVRATVSPFGANEVIGLVMHPGANRSCVLFAMFEDELTLSAHERAVLGQLGLHLETSARLRHRPESLLGELTSDGRVHALDRGAPRGELLERHGKRVALARSRSRRGDVDSLELWTALVDGRVSLVPRTRGSRTHYDVLENAPRWISTRALDEAEVAVLGLAARGTSTKLIGYALGISPSAVSTRLASAAAKLGMASRIELIRIAALLNNDRRATQPDAVLSAAEREILELLQQGLSNKEIAARRSRSVRTIANQVAGLLRKTGTGSRRELVVSMP